MNTNTQTLGQKLIFGSSYSYFSLVVNKAIGIVTAIFLARFLGPENLGIISIINYLLVLLLFFTGLGIPTACVKLIAEYNLKEKTKVSEFILAAFAFNFIIIIIITLLYYFAASYLAINIYRETKLIELIQLSALALFFFSLNQYLNSVIQAFAEFGRLSLISIFNSVFGLIAMIIFTKLFGLKGPVLSQAIASIATFLLIIKTMLFLKGKYSLSLQIIKYNIKNLYGNLKQYFRKLLSLTLPVFLSGLVMIPVLPVLTTLLTRLRGFTEVGFFNVAYSLTQIILFVPTAVGMAFIPLATKLAAEDRNRLNDFLLKTIYGVMIIVMILSFLLSFFSNTIINLFFSAKFIPSQNILLLLSAATFLSSFGYLVGYYLLAINKMWFALLMNLIWCIIIVTPAFFLIKFLGLVGLGLDYLIAYSFLTTIFVIYLKNGLKIVVKRLVLYLAIGVFIPIAVFILKLLTAPLGYYIILFIIFLVFISILLPKTINKKLIKELIGDKFNRSYYKNASN